MVAKILDGKRIGDELLDELRVRVQLRKQQGLAVPGLAVVLVGNDPASAIYVRNKRRACARVGFRSRDYDLAATATQVELIALIEQLNVDPQIHGILVQLPLPAHLDANAIVNRIDPRKDVDGFHPENIGRLALRQRGLRPCTSKGVMTLLAHTDRPVRGQDAIVVGVSNHVGRPMAFELMLAGCTTTACHKFTRDLPKVIGQGDIVIVATGRPGLVRGDWIKPGAVVIDVGINRLADGRLVGDVEYDAAAKRASWITPVPGGVGPMTVATLMQNTVEAAELS
jgi:methylenetetrahydrofolate dehydrogenase (NADP+)/methenyltetrahydrofolate cyclohydrolase